MKGRKIEVRKVREGLLSTRSQQGSSIWAVRQSWEQVICQNVYPWPRLLVHLSQHSRSFLLPCAEGGPKPTNPLAVMFWRKVIQFFMPEWEQSVLTASVCHKEAQLALNQLMDCLRSQSFVLFFQSAPRQQGQGQRQQYVPPAHACLCALLFYFHADSERNHISHIAFHSPFSL